MDIKVGLKELFDFTTVKSAPYGSDVSAGTYQCVDCGYVLKLPTRKSLPVCPKLEQTTHYKHAWTVCSDQADAKGDQYPNK